MTWIPHIFEKNGKANKSNYRFQFWVQENHPILLDDVGKSLSHYQLRFWLNNYYQLYYITSTSVFQSAPVVGRRI